MKFWQGKAKGCGSARCWQRHLNATYEPRFDLPWMEPTLFQRGFAALQYFGYRLLMPFVPVRWILDGRKWQDKLSCWVHGGAYFAESRMKGWI